MNLKCFRGISYKKKANGLEGFEDIVRMVPKGFQLLLPWFSNVFGVYCWCLYRLWMLKTDSLPQKLSWVEQFVLV